MIARIVAARGASSSHPENTMAAFAAAREAGADAISFDVQSTVDGEVVVIHDFDLERTTTGEGLVVSRPWEYVQDLDAGTWFDASFASERVPLFTDVLDQFGGDMRLHLDLKGFNADFVHAVMDIALQAGLTDEIFLTSEQLPLLLLARDQHPDARIVIAPPVLRSTTERTLRQVLLMTNAQLLDGDTVQCPIQDLDPYMIDRLRDLGAEIQATECNDKEAVERAVELEVDEISTVDPAMAANITRD